MEQLIVRQISERVPLKFPGQRKTAETPRGGNKLLSGVRHMRDN